ncbi:MAG: hypothetical protein HY744_25240 [Deltaproteobacteria bacterium]|nr:hypothetical protein [Deltaproteobacteria bacterium]
MDDTRAGALRQRIQLVDLGFIELSARYVAPVLKGTLSYEQPPVDVRWTRADAQVGAVFPFLFRIRISEGESPPQDLAELVVVIRLTYRVRDDAEMVGGDLRHYVGVTGYMHAWPYVRAEVQELTAKLGLPALLLPVVVSGDVPSRVRVGPPEQPVVSVHDAPDGGSVGGVVSAEPSPKFPLKLRPDFAHARELWAFSFWHGRRNVPMYICMVFLVLKAMWWY